MNIWHEWMNEWIVFFFSSLTLVCTNTQYILFIFLSFEPNGCSPNFGEISRVFLYIYIIMLCFISFSFLFSILDNLLKPRNEQISLEMWHGSPSTIYRLQLRTDSLVQSLIRKKKETNQTRRRQKKQQPKTQQRNNKKAIGLLLLWKRARVRNKERNNNNTNNNKNNTHSSKLNEASK